MAAKQRALVVDESPRAGTRGSTSLVPVLVLAAFWACAAPALAAPVYKIGDLYNTSNMSNEFAVFKGYIYFAGGTTGTSGSAQHDCLEHSQIEQHD